MKQSSAAAAPPPAQPQRTVPVEDPKKPATWECPNCGTVGAFRRFEILHQEGTKAISMKSATFGVGNHGNFGVASTATTGTQRTNLASQVAPPTAAVNSLGILILAAVVVGLSALGVMGLGHDYHFAGLGLVSVAAIFVLWAWAEKKKVESQRVELGAQQEEWKRKWMCMACGFTREQP
jgi:rubredoxin